MKRSLTLAAALVAVAPSLHAFSLDFLALNGINLPPSIDISVGGYGFVRLSPGTNYLDGTNSLAINQDFGPSAINLEAGDAFHVDFLAGPIVGFNAFILGQELGENVIVTSNVEQTSFRIVVGAPTTMDGVAISSLSFTVAPVPEPAAAMLGAMGAALLFRRRR